MNVIQIAAAIVIIVTTLSARSEYIDQGLIAMGSQDSDLGTVVVNFSGTDTIRQSFRIKPNDPLADSVRLHYLMLKSYYWAGTGASLTIRVCEGSTITPGKEIYRNSLNRKLDPSHSSFDGTSMIDAPSGVTYHQFADFKVVDTTGTIGVIDPEDTLVDIYSGLKLKTGKEYCFEIIVDSIVNRSYGFYESKSPYIGGFVNKVGGPSNKNSLWFKTCGTAISRMKKTTVCSDERNQFLLDTCGHFFADKMVGIKTTEYVKIPKSSSLTPVIQNGAIASVTKSIAGDSLVLALTGIAEGITNLFLLNGTDTVSMIRVTTTKRKHIDVSFTYINFPTETDHPLRSQAWADSITDSISTLYAGINVQLHWKFNGNREYLWDFDKDGTSYESDGRERWSPIDSGIIPNPTTVYSNLFLIRNKTALEGYDGNGGGSSRGMGGADKKPVRGAYKAINVSYTDGKYTGHSVAACVSTLAHELGHNLGLGHCTRHNTLHYPVAYDYLNIMKTGRDDERFFASQWDVVHREIKLAESLGESYPHDSTVARITPTKMPIADVVVSANPVTPHESHIAFAFPSGTSQATLRIFDATGNVVFVSQTESNQILWDLTNRNGLRVAGTFKASAVIVHKGTTKVWQSMIGVQK